MKKYYLIGENTSNSLSPAIHNWIYQFYNIQATYSSKNIDSSEFDSVVNNIYNDIKSNNINGLNITNPYKSRMFFSSTDGIYITDLTIYPTLHIPSVDASFITINTEQINDSTKVEYLYTNDANQSGKVLKYEAWTGVFVESIDVNGNALEVAFY